MSEKQQAWSYEYVLNDGNVVDLMIELIDGPYSHWRDENPGVEPSTFRQYAKLANTGDAKAWGIWVGPQTSIPEVVEAMFN